MGSSIEKSFRWLDPGIKEARDFSKAVILDVLKRYDVDGILTWMIIFTLTLSIRRMVNSRTGELTQPINKEAELCCTKIGGEIILIYLLETFIYL